MKETLPMKVGNAGVTANPVSHTAETSEPKGALDTKSFAFWVPENPKNI